MSDMRCVACDKPGAYMLKVGDALMLCCRRSVWCESKLRGEPLPAPMTPPAKPDALENLRRWAEGERDEAERAIVDSSYQTCVPWQAGRRTAMAEVIARIEAEQREETGA